MDYATDWLNLLVRWLHVVAAMAWIGTSFYFVYLDLSLRPPKERSDADEGVGGEFWAVHGGGFYHVQKYRVAPETLPEPLHWFKWEAYTTWLSGFALFTVLYYANPETYLIDRAVADLTAWQAIAVSVGSLALAWAVYDLLCRVLRGNEVVLAAAVSLFLAVSAYALSELLTGRAVYVQVGAMIGTIMAGNVLMNIIPAHRELIHAKDEGREPDATPLAKAKQRSVHNNYFTLPAVFAMISNHFPFTYGHEHGWLVLLAIMALGAWFRHFFNLRHRGRNVWAIPATTAVGALALAFVLAPEEGGTARTPRAGGGDVDFAQVEAIVEQRRAPCHSANPTMANTAPQGVVLDTPEQIQAQAEAIEEQAAVSKAMPPGNVTGMTQEERDLLADWVRQGAKVR